jgi:putative spermidine/putrescine transport system substrate-binding protein
MSQATNARTNAMISRRALLAAGAGLGLSAALPRSLMAQTDVSVTQFIWTGAQEVVPRRISDAYMAANPGVKIETMSGTNGATYPKLAASRDIDPNAPLINVGFFNLDATERGKLVDMWEPLDEASIPNLKHILPDYRQENDLGAFFCMDPCGLLYNTDKISEAPDSWEMLFDPKLKGKIALVDGFWAGNGVVPTAKLNGGSEDDIGIAIEMYAKAARDGQFHSLTTSNSQLQQLLVSGEVWLVPHLRGLAMAWRQDGAPVNYAAPKEGQVAFPEGFQIVKGSGEDKLKVCRELVNIALEADNVLDYCKTAHVVPLMDNVKLPEEMASHPSIQPEAIANSMVLDYAKIAANGPAWTQRWNKEVKANL